MRRARRVHSWIDGYCQHCGVLPEMASDAFCSRAQRTARRGSWRKDWEPVYARFGVHKVPLAKGRRLTYAEAWATYGDCIVTTTKHVAALVDGALHDTFDGRVYLFDDVAPDGAQGHERLQAPRPDAGDVHGSARRERAMSKARRINWHIPEMWLEPRPAPPPGMSHIKALRQMAGRRCAYCGEKVDRDKETVDHIIPLSRGGGKQFANQLYSCKRCNSAKSNAMPVGLTPLQIGRMIEQAESPIARERVIRRIGAAICGVRALPSGAVLGHAQDVRAMPVARVEPRQASPTRVLHEGEPDAFVESDSQVVESELVSPERSVASRPC